ncbi:Meiotically up-regulated gene 65 protein [Talaromyces islandicus]|uniref:Meiotically up-regulated gene 65 protein n=1 Tax=Talaromyces islandicus TaxID=28573 RepID=A0A0U1LPQ6_TALIS|nr:Meiotically up-regulated gene 65 protein [Talaromyces islandicus]
MAAKDDQGSISLVDNTAPSQSLMREATRTISNPSLPSVAKRLTRGSVRSSLTQRKYAKWQRERVETLDNDADTSPVRRGGGGGDPSTRSSLTDTLPTDNRTEDSRENRQSANLGLLNIVPTQTTRSGDPESSAAESTTPASELDILYENQRGWFFFGIPFYSHRSLLQFDPSAWVNKDYNDSPVDITNAQVPDPSWEWAWQSWFVDMSGDVDEEGWQYSFSFGLKCGWHGTHPWFHSYVRRRRWVRLRTKKRHFRGRNMTGQTVMELAHKLNEDYFTIHSQNAASREPSLADPTASLPGYVRHSAGALPGVSLVEEVEDIPTLLQALKDAIIDREKVEILRKFLAQGGEELFYLADRVPEILSIFVFQTSRWQFMKLLQDGVDEASQDEQQEDDDKEVEATRRRRNNLSRAIDAVNKEISDYDVFDVTKEAHISTGSSETHHSSAASSGKGKAREMGEIRGIPEAANIGKEGHIY